MQSHVAFTKQIIFNVLKLTVVLTYISTYRVKLAYLLSLYLVKACQFIVICVREKPETSISNIDITKQESYNTITHFLKGQFNQELWRSWFNLKQLQSLPNKERLVLIPNQLINSVGSFIWVCKLDRSNIFIPQNSGTCLLQNIWFLRRSCTFKQHSPFRSLNSYLPFSI